MTRGDIYFDKIVHIVWTGMNDKLPMAMVELNKLSRVMTHDLNNAMWRYYAQMSIMQNIMNSVVSEVNCD